MIDWNKTAKQAENMTDAQLAGALQDILETLPHADAMDRETGSDRGGFYRDQASVYRKEQARRAK